MTKLQLWDISSATLLSVTTDAYTMGETLSALISEAGFDMLEELNLTVKKDDAPARNFAGIQIMSFIQEEVRGTVV